MYAYNITADELRKIADGLGLGITTDNPQDGRKRVRFSLKWLPDGDGYNTYRHKSISWNSERWTRSVCYHGHFDFLYEVFANHPDARVTSSYYMKCDYRGTESFKEQARKLAHLQIGAPIMGGYPTMIESCECNAQSYGIHHDL